MDLSSVHNMRDLRLVFTFKPLPALNIALEGHRQQLDRTTDFCYNVADLPRNVTAPGNLVGSGSSYRIPPSTPAKSAANWIWSSAGPSLHTARSSLA